MTTVPATTAILAAALLPVPGLPDLGPIGPEPGDEAAQVEPTGQLTAADGRLRRGCKSYAFTYAVTTRSSDWMLDITLRDRRDKGVNAQTLVGNSDPPSGTITYQLCRWATVPGDFSLRGLLTSYDGDQATAVPLTETFRLRRTRPSGR